MRILLVEDDFLLGESIVAALQLEGYAIDWVQNGQTAIHSLSMPETHDLMLLDLGLPDMSGIKILQKIRKSDNPIPTIILTAQNRISDRVQGLDAGADDYLTKPFDINELTARIRSVSRRSQGRASGEIEKGLLTLNSASHEVTHHGKAVNLTRREFTIFQILFENEGHAVTKTRLEESLYAWGDDVESNTIEVYISRLRKKIDRDLILTLRGIGYKLECKP
jgi:two-component system response regulator QseB